MFLMTVDTLSANFTLENIEKIPIYPHFCLEKAFSMI